MSDIDLFISFKNNRGEVLCNGKIIEIDYKIFFFASLNNHYIMEQYQLKKKTLKNYINKYSL